MMAAEGTVERAFELARSGTCRTVDDIRAKLKAEGHSNIMAHFEGGSFKKQLKAIMAAGR
jgi:hypothetical protein